MTLTKSVVIDTLHYIHYEILTVSEDTVTAVNPLGQKRTFDIKVINKGTVAEEYFIHANSLDFLTVDNADDIFPIEFELEAENKQIRFRDYYYRLTDIQRDKLQNLYS